MITINTIRKPIESELAEFNNFVKQNFSAEDGLIAEMLEYVLSSRGKGIRPILVMLRKRRTFWQANIPGSDAC